MNAFSQKNVAFAQALDPYVTTIQAQYDIGGLNRAWGFIARKKPDTGDFTDYYPERYFDYDQRNFKVSGIQDKNAPNGRYVDICSTSYNQHVFIGASQNVFSGLDGMGLADFMLENGWDVILGDGLYATACVPSTLCGALLKKFKVYAVTDMILTHPRLAREQKPHDAVIASYPDAIQRIDSVTTLQLVV
jgi:hypothetical protein